MGLNGIDNDESVIAYDKVQKSQAHFGTFRDENGWMSGEAPVSLAGNAQSNGVIREKVVAQTQQQSIGAGEVPVRTGFRSTWFEIGNRLRIRTSRDKKPRLERWGGPRSSELRVSFGAGNLQFEFHSWLI